MTGKNIRRFLRDSFWDAAGGTRAIDLMACIALWVGLTMLTGATPTVADAASADAMAQVKSAVAKARQLLADPAYKSAPESKRAQLLKLLDDNFDFDGMARSSLGSYWKQLGPAERQHFVGLFHQRLERRYVRIIEDYSGAQINFLRQNSTGPDRAEVYTNVVNPMLAEPLELNYLLRRTHDTWKVYDINIAGISEVDSYRKEYNQVINSQGYAALLKKLSAP